MSWETGSNTEHQFDNILVVAVTNSAYLLSEGSDEEWFPKSQIDWDVMDDGKDPKRGDTTTFYIPEWLAEEKGWL